MRLSKIESEMTLRFAEREIDCDLIIFDLSNTLEDAKPRFQALARCRASALQSLVDEDAVRKWAENSGVNLITWEVYEDGPLARASRKEDLIVAASAVCASGRGWEEAKELAGRAYEEADERLAQSYRPVLFDGVEEILEGLAESGYKLAVATNDRRMVAEETLMSVGVFDLFQTVVGADDVENPKPAPEMILLTCERCWTSPQEAIHVGDSPSDMRAGKAAKLKAVIAVSQGSEPSRELVDLADITIRSFRDIKTS